MAKIWMLLRVLRSSVFVVVLFSVLLASTIGLGMKVMTLTAKVGALTASAAATAIHNRKEISRAVARAKAKARLRRYIAAIPIVGIGAAAAFENQDYNEWLVENPNGDLDQYSCEVAEISAEIIDEVLAELPDSVPDWSKPSADQILSKVSDCKEAL